MKESQTDLLEHSEQKVKLLEAYLGAYFPVIGNDGHTEEIQITDVFCGEGMFPNGKIGSPLLLGRMGAALLAKNPRAPRIKFRFNDGVLAKVERVYAYLEPLESKHNRLTLLPSNKSYNDLLPILLEEKQRMSHRGQSFKTKVNHFTSASSLFNFFISALDSLTRFSATDTLASPPIANFSANQLLRTLVCLRTSATKIDFSSSQRPLPARSLGWFGISKKFRPSLRSLSASY